MDEGYLQNLQTTSGCVGDRHVFSPLIGDPMPLMRWNGYRCLCGARRLEYKKCEFGYEHLTQEPA